MRELIFIKKMVSASRTSQFNIFKYPDFESDAFVIDYHQVHELVVFCFEVRS